MCLDFGDLVFWGLFWVVQVENMDVDAIDLVEKRIEALERQILPKGPQPSNVKFQPITDLLTQTQTMISSALSCREAITTTLQQLDTINSYLDPNNGENDLEVEAKRQYLLELYPEVSLRLFY